MNKMNKMIKHLVYFIGYSIIARYFLPKKDVQLKIYNTDNKIIGIDNKDYIFANRVSYWIDGYNFYGPPRYKISQWYWRRINLVIDETKILKIDLKT